MEKKERVFALNDEGCYKQTTRNSSHYSIIQANSRMVELGFIRCNQVYKGQSHFKNADDEEFFRRNKSTPCKMTLSKSYNMTASTHLTNSTYQQKNNCFQIQKSRPGDELFSTARQVRHTRNGSDTSNMKYIYEETKKFQLPKHFEQSNIKLGIGQSSVNVYETPYKITLAESSEKKVINKFNIEQSPQKIQRKHQKNFYTPKTEISTPEKELEFSRSSKISPIRAQSNIASNFERNFKKQHYCAQKINQPYQNIKNQQQSSNIRRVLYTPDQRNQYIESKQAYKSPSIIRYEDRRTTYSPYAHSNYSGIQSNHQNITSNDTLKNSTEQHKLNQINIQKGQVNKNYENTNKKSYEQELQQKILKLQEQLNCKERELVDCKRKLNDGEYKQKVMKYEIDKLRTSKANQNVIIKHNTIRLNQYQNYTSGQRDWGKEFREGVEGGNNQKSKSALLFFTLFMVLLCKQTLN